MQKLIFLISLLFITITQAQESASPLDFIQQQTLTLTSFDENETQKNDDIPFGLLQNFVDVFDAVKTHHIETLDNRKLFEGAIKGMLHHLDPYAHYYNEKEYEKFLESTQESYAGIGVTLNIQSGQVRILSVMQNSPAEQAGLKSGDKILKIDGRALYDLSYSEIDSLISGEIGSQVQLTIDHDGIQQNHLLQREKIHRQVLSAKTLNEQNIYIKIKEFQDHSDEDLTKEIQALNVRNPIQGLILDLRDNPGGSLQSAIEIADLFLEQGEILSVRGRDPQQYIQYNANQGDILNGAPIIILINQNSASASEILAGALQDNHRALIVGKKSFGKGTVQSVLPLYHGGAIKITTAHYYTPSGKNIQDHGILPDITSDKTEDEEALIQETQNLLRAMRFQNNHQKHTPF